MINRFFTPEERDSLKKVSTPYTTNLAQLVIEALDGSTASEPGYPNLVKAAKSVGAYVWLRPRRGAERRATAGALLGFSFTRLKRQRT